MALPLQFLYFTTQSFLPGVRWDAGAHHRLVAGFFALMLLSSVVCGLVSCLLPGRYAVSRRARFGWGLAGFVFGWAGLVLMLVMNEWPARNVCARCGMLRVVTRDTCEHCGAPQAAPHPDGTEIFEQAADQSQPLMAVG